MKYFSMFSGIGGFEKGIDKAYGARYNDNKHESENARPTDCESGRLGATDKQNNGVLLADDAPLCVGFSEIDRNAIAIYRYHYNHRNFGDASRIVCDDLPGFNLLVGGFPCQAFSIAGKRGGFLDTRGTLFFEIARILEAKKPKHFLLENVKGLFSHDEGRTFKTIVGTLADLGYCVEWDCLNSKFYGVPQNRERVFIVGHLGRLPRREVFPVEESDGRDSETLRGFSIVRGRNKNTSGCLDTRGVNAFDRADLDKLIFPDLRALNDERQGNRIYDGEGLAATITSNTTGGCKLDRYQVENRIRRLTPLECERLQGFDDGWTKHGINEKGEVIQMSDSARYKALGNAVTVNVISAIIRKMMVCCD